MAGAQAGCPRRVQGLARSSTGVRDSVRGRSQPGGSRFLKAWPPACRETRFEPVAPCCPGPARRPDGAVVSGVGCGRLPVTAWAAWPWRSPLSLPPLSWEDGDPANPSKVLRAPAPLHRSWRCGRRLTWRWPWVLMGGPADRSVPCPRGPRRFFLCTGAWSSRSIAVSRKRPGPSPRTFPQKEKPPCSPQSVPVAQDPCWPQGVTCRPLPRWAPPGLGAAGWILSSGIRTQVPRWLCWAWGA